MAAFKKRVAGLGSAAPRQGHCVAHERACPRAREAPGAGALRAPGLASGGGDSIWRQACGFPELLLAWLVRPSQLFSVAVPIARVQTETKLKVYLIRIAH